jgi:hypothetical protein
MKNLGRAIMALLLGVSASVFLLFSMRFPPPHDWVFDWSQPFWEPIFPSSPGYSAPSEGCLAAMLASDIFVLSVSFFVIFSIRARRRFISN